MEPLFDGFVWAHWDKMHVIKFWGWGFETLVWAFDSWSLLRPFLPASPSCFCKNQKHAALYSPTHEAIVSGVGGSGISPSAWLLSSLLPRALPRVPLLTSHSFSLFQHLPFSSSLSSVSFLSSILPLPSVLSTPLFHFYELTDSVQLITVIIWWTAEQSDDSALHGCEPHQFPPFWWVKA